MGEETQALVAELSEVTVLPKMRPLDLWGTQLTDDCYHSQLFNTTKKTSGTCLVELLAVCSMTRKIPLLK